MPERVAGDDAVENPDHLTSFTELPRATRRRLIAGALLRSSSTTVVLLLAYTFLPFTLITDAGYLVAFLLGMLLVIGVLVVEVNKTLHARYPRLQAVEAMTVAGPLFLVLFASLHYVIGEFGDGAYSQPMDRLDALYFTVTTFATVGFGDIAPVSSTARLVTMVQMVGGLVLVGLIARLLLGIAQHSVERRVTTPDPADLPRRPPPPPSSAPPR